MDNEVDDKECCGLLHTRLNEWLDKGCRIFVSKTILRDSEGKILEENVNGYVVKCPEDITVNLNSKGLIF